MITKIFYSLVLFPDINYNSKIIGYSIFDIVEEKLWLIKIIFKKWWGFTEVFFLHKDFAKEEHEYITRNWYIYSQSQDLLKLIFSLIEKKDIYDFNFFKDKNFYKKIPFWTVLNITTKCNLFCNYCFNDYDYPLETRNTKKTLWLEDFKKIIDELYDAWTRDLILTGWEPFSCPFLWELLDYIKKKNIFIRINTNGTLLFDTTLKKLNDNYSVHLMVSLHEFNNKDYYDINKKWAQNIYGIKGLKKWEKKYDEKMLRLKRVELYENITLDFLTILTPKNILYLENIYTYVLGNFRIIDWHFFRLFSTGTTKWISKEMISLAIHKIFKLNKYYKTNFKIVDAVPFCVTKNTHIASQVIDWELSQNHNVKTIITADGNIQIMSAFDMNLWNIFDLWIEKVWQWDFVQKKLSNWFLPRDCYDCKYKHECMWGSRMNANIFNGSYDALDPLCNLDNKQVWEIKY